ncbi:hypothetical protein PSHT_15010 [Puccinia striiformis]|uniref:Acyl-CoA oxidase C-terminal domain-containing protein n=1 Tax=Puccinia striiformis TaxID=27350 RepID=A0A2S4UHQ8_9BASI|nr:hypothetical protein Pst134EB_002032 [Puccinia striiformis f. sp. tritici]POV96674.1 hypothetical protein PSHT_15010 [Puccinia striiformis]
MNTKRFGAWLIDSPELEFRLPNALDVRVTVESTSPFGRPDKILVHGFFGSWNSKTRRLFGSRPPNFKNNIFCQFRDALALLSDEEPQTLKTLTTICQLFGAFQIEENAAYFLKYEFYTPKQMDIVSETVTRLCAEVRGCVVLLIDAFRHSDHIINSPFGKYDGNIYSAYFNAVQVANPLPPVHPYFDRLMKPMLTQEPLEMGDASQIGINQEIEEIQQERLQGVNKSNEGAIPLTESQRQETEGVAEWEKKFPSKRAKKLFYYF